jgi:putative IMPACT (imprinted ancient) family translation regulator
LDYNYLDNFINVLSRFNGEVIDRNFDENITVNFKLPLKNEEEFKAILKTKNLEINHA